MPTCRTKPSRADTARANGAKSHGPVTEDGKRRSSMNSLAHGLRARAHVTVAALGETERRPTRPTSPPSGPSSEP